MKNNKTIKDNEITAFCPVIIPYAGCYRIGGGNTGNVSFSLGKKPIWLHRKLMKLCLGWEWVDNT